MEKWKQKTKVVIYTRFSTTDKGQKTDNQLLQFQELCEQQDWDILETYVNKEWGRKGRRERGDFSHMFDDAGKRKFNMVSFWSLNHFTHQGIQTSIFYLKQLDQLGVWFKSLTEPLRSGK